MSKKIISFIMILSLCVSLSGCGGNKDNQTTETSETGAVISSKSTIAEEVQEDTSKTETTTTTEAPKHESPIETINYSMCGQVSGISEIMNYDTNKNKKISLKELVPEGAKVKSFKFVFYSEDGKDIGTYKGGCGISVNDDCPSATNDGWYQSDDFSATAEGSYLEVDWEVPSDIQDYVNTSGDVQIGYWWSDNANLKLDEVICSYENTAEISCDETKSKDINSTLSYDGENKIEIPLSELVSEDNTPRFISVTVCNADVTSSVSMGKIVMGMGLSNSSGDYFESPSLVKLSNSGNETISWLITDDIYSKLDNNGNLTIGFWWGELSSINVMKVEVKSAYNDGTITNQTDTTTTIEEINTSTEETSKQDTSTEEVIVSDDMKNITSAQIVEDMKIGWNLGNSLDCYNVTGDAEIYWGNPKTTKEMIDKVKSAGFNAVRIPVSWTDHINNNNKIDEQWLSRVKEVVDYVIDNDMYAIINVHHDDYTWLNPTYADQKEVTTRLTAIWDTVANEFKDYDYHLLFEGMNEPRVIGGTDEWTCGTDEERDVINQLEQAFVDTVRATGGNNQYRTLIVTTHSASIDETSVKSLIVPKDDRVIVSIHYYSPWDFVGNESDINTWGTDEEKQTLDNGFKLLYDTFISKNIPVIIGEFGTVDKDNDEARANYFNYYIQSAKSYGITCFVWDNNEDFILLDRDTNSWDNESIITSMMNGLN